MPLTVVDLDAAMVAGQSKAQQWEAEFQGRFFGPLLLAQAVQEFLALRPEQQQQLAAADPEAFDELKAQVARIRGGLSGQST